MNKNCLKIDASACSDFNNALHASFHARIHGLIDAETDKSVLNLEQGDVDEYGKSIAAEKDLNRVAQGSAYTKKKAQADAKRDKGFSYLQGIVSYSQMSPDEETSRFAEELMILLRPYRNVPNEADNAETLLIEGLITDLRKPEYAEHIEALGLEPAISALETANREFDALVQEQAAARVANKPVLSTRAQRRETVELYNQLCAVIYAAELTCKDAEKLKKITELIKKMNDAIGEFRASHNRSKGIQAADKPDESDRPVIPDENEEPEDPDQEEPTDPEGGEDDRPEIPDEGKEEPGKDENGDDLPPIE